MSGNKQIDGGVSTEQRLEQWLHAACLQSEIRAPESMHDAVIHSIERRAHQWWRKPAMHWPMWAGLVLSLSCVISLWFLVVAVPLTGSWMGVIGGVVQVFLDLMWTLLTGLNMEWALAISACVLAVAAGFASLQRLALREL